MKNHTHLKKKNDALSLNSQGYAKFEIFNMNIESHRLELFYQKESMVLTIIRY